MFNFNQAYIKFGVLFAFLGIITKIILWKTGYLAADATYSAMAYLLFLLISIFLTVLHFKNHPPKKISYLDEFKYGMRSVGVFAIIVSSFSYFYYTNIDSTYFPRRIKERMELAQTTDLSTINSPKKMTRETVVANEKRISTTIFNAKNHAGISLFLFTFLGMIYCAIIVGIMHAIPHANPFSK